MRISNNKILLGIILLISTVLNFYKLSELMMFIGDFGWFYISARDMLLTGTIPLVGIPSSHPWLHQGPLWTYMLAGAFSISNFHPVSGAYVTAGIGVLSVFLMYKVGRELFSQRVGLISSFLYATSPLIVIHARMPYHTAPIPFFMLLLLLSLYKWIKGNPFYFPFSIFLLSLLYNLELSTTSLWFILILLLVGGIWKKKTWVLRIANTKILLLSLVCFVFPMLPILIYDVQNGYPHTIKFAAWIGYRILRLFGFPSIHGLADTTNFSSFLTTSFTFYQRIVFLENSIVAGVIFLVSTGLLFLKLYHLFRKREHHIGYNLLAFVFLTTVAGYFVNKSPSEAHVPIFFPTIILIVALLFDHLMKKNRKYMFVSLIAIIVIAYLNSFTLLANDFLMGKEGGYGHTLANRLEVSQRIVKEAEKKDYQLVGNGAGSEFESFTMNYEFLTWWLGHGISQQNPTISFVITEFSDRIHIEKLSNKR